MNAADATARLVIDSKNFNEDLARLASDVRVNAVRVVKTQARLLLVEIIKWTPPYAKAGSSAQAKRLGENAVANDIYQYWGTVRKDNPKSQVDFLTHRNNVLEMAKARDYGKFNEMMNDMHKRKAIPFDRNLIRRGARHGVHINNLRRRTLDREGLDKYVKDLQKRVGWAKAGWAKSAAELGIALPAYVRRHSNTGSNYRFVRRGNEILVEMANSNIHIPRYENQIALAMRVRSKAMHADIKRIAAGGKHRY
jgi:hypothetical protein